MVFAFLPVQANQSLPSKINRVFLLEIEKSQNLIPLMVELKNDPVTVFAVNSFESKNYYTLSTFDYGANGEELYRSNIISVQDLFLQKLQKQGISFSFKYRCTDVLNSVALDVKGSDIERLLHFSEINQIYDDRTVLYAARELAAETTGANRAWKGVGTSGNITGKGVVVGVLDTGLDKVHMTDGEFKGRVLGGFDFADGDSDFNDDGPVGHGTHVAGIIGGKGKMESQKGMAYEVKFRIYKVFPTKGSGGRSIPQAIDRSVQEKCNVINMSLGSEGDATVPAKNTPYYGSIVTNATKAGTMVVASAGNSGSRGKSQAFPAGSPGITEDAFCIAATNDRPINTFTVSTDAITKNIRLAEAAGAPTFDKSLSDLPLVPCGYGRTEDFEEDVSGKIALIQRGPKEDKDNNVSPITFREKMDNAMALGAKAVLIYDHSSGALFSPTIFSNEDSGKETFIPTALMTLQDGLWLLSILSGTYHLNFSLISQKSIATFSSMGPTPDGFFKPEITAPGTNILSTYPKGSYVPMSGTSMSSPAVTGLVALLKQAYPKWNTNQIKSALMNTAEILINPINNIPTTFLLQGAGEARIDRALVTPALITPRALLIQKEKIEPGKLNPDQAVTFTLESNSASNQSFGLTYKIFGFPEEESLIKLSFEKETVDVPSNQKADFKATFSIDWNLLTKNSYEGIIQVGDSLHIPFVIFRDSVLKVPDAITNISIGPKELTFSKDDVQEQDIKIKFSLNTGSEYKTTQVAGGSDYNNYANIELYVTDDQGETWGTIAYLSGYVVGDYEYHWNGKGIDGKYFLPKGNFFVQFRIMGTNYDKPQDPSYVYFSSDRDENSKIDITQSNVPGPSEVILTGSKIVQKNELFEISLLFPEVANCLGVEIELAYDAKKLMGKEIIDGGFLSSDGVSVTFDQSIDDDKGIINVTIHRDENIGISGTHAKILSILFKAIDTGKLKFSLKTSKVLFTEDTYAKMKAIYPDIRISKYDDFLLADLNNDKTVDNYDWLQFMESYPSTIKDANYKSNCDFNQDQLINFEDFIILSREYGKSI
jgi:minor extracellular serine protease Vpr